MTKYDILTGTQTRAVIPGNTVYFPLFSAFESKDAIRVVFLMESNWIVIKFLKPNYKLLSIKFQHKCDNDNTTNLKSLIELNSWNTNKEISITQPLMEAICRVARCIKSGKYRMEFYYE